MEKQIKKSTFEKDYKNLTIEEMLAKYDISVTLLYRLLRDYQIPRKGRGRRNTLKLI